MAWRRPGDKPLSESMMVRLPTHICVTRPQWVNEAESLMMMKRFISLNTTKYQWFSPHWVTNHFLVSHTYAPGFICLSSILMTVLDLSDSAKWNRSTNMFVMVKGNCSYTDHRYGYTSSLIGNWKCQVLIKNIHSHRSDGPTIYPLCIWGPTFKHYWLNA